MATKDIIKHLIKVTENDFASVVSAGIVGDCSTFVDTGSYSLNALLSGSLSVSYTHLTLPTILLV